MMDKLWMFRIVAVKDDGLLMALTLDNTLITIINGVGAKPGDNLHSMCTAMRRSPASPRTAT